MTALSRGPDIDQQKYDSAAFVSEYTHLEGLDDVFRHIVYVTFRHYISAEVYSELLTHPEFVAHIDLHEQKIRTRYMEVISALSNRVADNYHGRYFNGVVAYLPDAVLWLASNELEEAASDLGIAIHRWDIHDFDTEYMSKLSPLVKLVSPDTVRASPERHMRDKERLAALVNDDPMGKTNAVYYRRLTNNHSLFMAILAPSLEFTTAFSMKSGAPSNRSIPDVYADLLLMAAYSTFDYDEMVVTYDKDGTDAKMQERCRAAVAARASEAYYAYNGLHSFYSRFWTPRYGQLLPENSDGWFPLSENRSDR